MKKFLKWTGFVVAGIVGVALMALAWVYFASESILNRDTQIATVLRKGVKPDRHTVLFMPSEMFRHLSDADLARVIAYLRTVPATAEGVEEKTEVRILGRLILAKGDYKPAALAMETLPAAMTSFDAADPASHGRHLAMNFCSECHGQDLNGFAPLNTPPLGDRQLKMMSDTSRVRFSKFTPHEVAAVHAFLRSL